MRFIALGSIGFGWKVCEVFVAALQMKKIALFEFIPTWYDVSELTELHLYPDNANKVTL